MGKRGVRRTVVAGWVLLVAGLSAAPVAAQTGIVSGTITNANGGAPVAGIRVELYDGGGVFTGLSSSASAANGSYTIASVPPGPYFVRTAGPPPFLDKVYDGGAGLVCLGCNPLTAAGATAITVQVNATRANTNFAVLATGRISNRGVNASANSHASVFVDAPGQPTIATRPFTLTGWAVDQGSVSGTGINAIVVWAFPTSGQPATLVGTAGYGLSRPDVGTALGDAEFEHSGFSITLDRTTLPAGGTYDLMAFGRSTVTADFTAVRVVRLTVE